MMKKLFIVVIVGLLFATSVFAQIKAGYILKNPSAPVSEYMGAMQEMGIQVTLLDSDQILTYDLSQFDFLLVGNEQFPNPSQIPINDYRTIIANSYHLSTWHWSNKVSQMVGSTPLTAVKNMPTHLINQGMPNPIPIYTQCCFPFPPVGIPLYYLKSGDRASQIDPVVSTTLATSDVAVGTIDPGERLRDGVIATQKGVFYGIQNTPYWTPEAKQLFKNSITWLLADTTPPVISNVQVTSIMPTSATVTFTTDDPTNVTITVLKAGLPFMTVYGGNFDMQHSHLLQGLTPETGYTFTLKVCNSSGYCTTSSSFSFSTIAIPDLTPPVMSNLAVDVTFNSATFSFTTDDVSNVTVLYGTTPSLGSSFPDNTLTKNHITQVSGLHDNTFYYYSLELCNQFSICATYGPFNFTTHRLPDTTAPVISNIQVLDITHNTARISYDTDDAANRSIHYGIDSLSTVVENGQFATHVDQELVGLLYNSTYSFQITSCNVDGPCSSSPIGNFTTKTSDDITAPLPPNNVRIAVEGNNDINLLWDASPSNDTAGYHIYSADSPTGFDFTSHSATVTGNNYTDSSAHSSPKRFYIIRAFDHVLNEETNLYVVGKFDLDLFQGYNFVSLPLQPIDSSLSSIMHEGAAYNPVRDVLSWTGSGFIKASFDATENDFWKNNGLDSLSSGNGYYFNTLQPTTFTLVGRPITSVQHVQLHSGLNAIGMNSLEQRPLQTAFSSPFMSEISRKSSTGRFDIATQYPSGWFSADGFTSLEPGRGYWISVSQDVEWTYSP